MHHLTPRAPPICRKDHPCIERSASHFQLFPLTMGDRRYNQMEEPNRHFAGNWAQEDELVKAVDALS